MGVITWREVGILLGRLGVDGVYLARLIKEGLDNNDPNLLGVMESKRKFLQFIADTILSQDKKLREPVGVEHEEILDDLMKELDVRQEH